MNRELQDMLVDYDNFWDESVREGVAYFFHWQAEPEATVLVVWEGRRLTHIEARKRGDILLSQDEAPSCVVEVVRAFADAGFQCGTS